MQGPRQKEKRLREAGRNNGREKLRHEIRERQTGSGKGVQGNKRRWTEEPQGERLH